MDTESGNLPTPGNPGRLRELFARPGVVRIVGAHNPLGARLAERAGFDGVWSSGLEISASQGLPDTDLLTMSDLLAVASSMTAAVDVPVVADCDAGYGNALNVMHMIRRYERAGLAAVSIEDKTFPKVNSFIAGRQELCPLDEFCGKIEAAKSTQISTDFMVIARIEALIAGQGMEEALRRGEAYAEAGADAVLIHAKGDSPEPVLEFLQRWRTDLPVVVVPTTYHTITADELGAAGAKMVIYANHGLRAGISAVSEVFDAILRQGRSTEIEGRIAPLATVFGLQGMEQLKKDEDRFVRGGAPSGRAVIVPGVGSDDLAAPNAVGAATLAELRASALRESGVSTIVDVSPDALSKSTGDVAAALAQLPSGFAGRTLVSASGLLVDAEPLRWLSASTADITALVDMTARTEQGGQPNGIPVALASKRSAGWSLGGRLVTAFGGAAADAEFSGVAAFSPKGFAALQQAAQKRISFHGQPAALSDLLGDLVSTGWAVQAVGTVGGWTEVSSPEELQELLTLMDEQVSL